MLIFFSLLILGDSFFFVYSGGLYRKITSDCNLEKKKWIEIKEENETKNKDVDTLKKMR